MHGGLGIVPGPNLPQFGLKSNDNKLITNSLVSQTAVLY